jgi:threonine/homoserine/homoserine lactone efflux protein
MTSGQVLTFGGVVALGAMSPGPDFAVVMRRSALAGRAHGMATAVGVAAWVFVWAVAAATGVAALVAVTPVAFTIVKLVGAGYLVYLGVNALRSAWRSGDLRSGFNAGSIAEPGLWGAFRDGLLCNALNPKAAIFFVALLPQFLPASAGLVPMLTLSLIAVVVTAAWFVTVATVVATARRALSRPAARRLIDAVSGTVLIGLGVRLVFTTAR